VDEVPRPSVILVPSFLSHAAIAALTESASFPLLFRDFQAFSSPDPIDPLEVHAPAFLSKLGRDKPITVSRIFPHQLVNPFEQTPLFFRLGFRF